MVWQSTRRTPGDYIHPAKQRRTLTAHAGTCHLCGHPDSDSVDHVIPFAEWNHPTLSVHDQSNLRPAHLAPCPHCGRACHDDKTKAEAARGRARTQQARKSLASRPLEQHPGSIG